MPTINDPPLASVRETFQPDHVQKTTVSLGSDRFQRPVDLMTQQDHFSQREVGITHPDLPSFFRLTDDGNIEIMACEGLSIIFNAALKTLYITADHIKFHTKEQDGMHWNRLSFNSKATTFNEPSFLDVIDTDAQHIYKGADAYWDTSL